MDSCQIFCFLFGTKKARSDLGRRFANLNERGRQSRSQQSKNCNRIQANKKDESIKNSSIGEIFTSSPLKQIQAKIIGFASNTRGASQQSRRSSSCDAKCGTYRATLVQSYELDDEVTEEVGYLLQDDTNQNDEIHQDEQCPCPDKTKELIETQPKSGKINTRLDAVDTIHGSDFPKFKHVILYEDDILDNPVLKSEPQVYRMVSEFGEARAKLRRISSDSANQFEHDNTDGVDIGAGYNIKKEDMSQGQPMSNKKMATEIVQRNDHVCGLVRLFELSNRESISQAPFQEQNDKSPAKHPVKLCEKSGRSLHLSQKPTTIVKPLPPKIPPKCKRAKFLNLQLNLNRPVNIEQLFLNEEFLIRFFSHIDPIERCTAAQVCRRWKNVLYSNGLFWKDLISVIDCTQLRREHLIECIMNTLETAKSKQTRNDNLHNSTSHTHQISSYTNSNSFLTQRFEVSQHSNHSQDSLYNFAGQQSTNIQLDQDEIWRIQELCNRFTQRSFIGLTNSRNIQLSSLDSTEEQQQAMILNHTSQTSKSSSIPSQISSTFSSVSMSSLLSPLSEASRVESIREKMYHSLDEREFNAISLVGATDDDIENLVNKIPNNTPKRISTVRLNNCCITDRGFDIFTRTFKNTEELELTGCNEITNGIELTQLSKLKRLIITDCINIADGLAQQLVPISHQLEELTIQAYHLTDAFLNYLSNNSKLTRLKRFELSDCKEITDDSMAIMADHLGQLESLSLSGSLKISDAGIEILSEKIKNLRVLDLSWGIKITDASLECIAYDLGSSLTDLILDRNIHITNEGISYLATMNKLTLLYIRWCLRISDSGLESLLTGSKTIRYLSIAGLNQITIRSLQRMIETELVEVELTNCPAVTNDLLEYFSTTMPKCNIIF